MIVKGDTSGSLIRNWLVDTKQEFVCEDLNSRCINMLDFDLHV